MKTLQLTFNKWLECVKAAFSLNALKQSIRALDIKPAPPALPQLFAAIEEDFAANNTAAVFEKLRKALIICPQNFEALLMLSEMCLTHGYLHEGRALARRGTKLYKNNVKFYQLLGNFNAYLGDLKGSAKAFKNALKIEPNYPTAQHLLNAVLKKNPKVAPREYIRNLFNSYAEGYDTSLLQNLDYKSHIELVDYLCFLIPEFSIDSVLDLGCGTGLFALELSKKFKVGKFVGVDLSESMLEKSYERNLYSELHNNDLIEYLQQTNVAYDLITATDVLVYIGDLEHVVAYSYKTLKPGGYFGFTVEALDKGSYELTLSGRYKHSLNYLTTLSNRYRFSKIYSKTIALRKEYGNNVAGYLVLLQK